MLMTYQSMNTAPKAKKVRHLRTKKPHSPTTTLSMAGTKPGVGTMTMQLKLEEIWTETLTRTNLLEYLEIPGLKLILDRAKFELDFLNLLFPLNLCVWITNETNRYM